MRVLNTTRNLRENVFVIFIGLSIRSGAERNDTFQKALLLYEGGSLHTEKQAKPCHFKMCSMTTDEWSR
jgi:hypothetical protein